MITLDTGHNAFLNRSTYRSIFWAHWEQVQRGLKFRTRILLMRTHKEGQSIRCHEPCCKLGDLGRTPYGICLLPGMLYGKLPKSAARISPKVHLSLVGGPRHLGAQKLSLRLPIAQSRSYYVLFTYCGAQNRDYLHTWIPKICSLPSSRHGLVRRTEGRLHPRALEEVDALPGRPSIKALYSKA